MNIDWQSAGVTAVVILAVVYLAYQGWQTFTNKKTGCCGGGCDDCNEKESSAKQRPFVPLERLTQQREEP